MDSLNKAVKWLLTNWEFLIAIVGLLITILNSITTHFTLRDSKVGKFLGWLTEFLSVLTSSGVRTALWKLKLPFMSVPPASEDKTPTEPPEIPKVPGPTTVGILLICLGSMLVQTGCANWKSNTKDTLTGVFDVTKTLDSISNTFMHAKCMEIAKTQCKPPVPSAPSSQPTAAPVPPYVCKPLVECQETKHAIENGAISIYHVVAAGLTAVQLNEETSSAEWVKAAQTILTNLRGLIESTGIWNKVAPLKTILGEKK